MTPATDSTSAGSTANGEQDAAPKAAPEPRYTREALREAPRLVGKGVNPHAIIGALSGDGRKTFTIDEVAAALKDFGKKELTA